MAVCCQSLLYLDQMLCKDQIIEESPSVSNRCFDVFLFTLFHLMKSYSQANLKSQQVKDLYKTLLLIVLNILVNLLSSCLIQIQIQNMQLEIPPLLSKEILDRQICILKSLLQWFKIYRLLSNVILSLLFILKVLINNFLYSNMNFNHHIKINNKR